MLNLCLPMKVINITQHSGGSYSHPNNCLDLAGSDSGIDFAYAMGDYWRCIAGPWGSNTYFFTACDEKGKEVKVHCADGVNRLVTVAMTHSNLFFIQPVLGKIYKNGEAIYEEGTAGQTTGNHIHYEVAEGLQYSKYWDEHLSVWRMNNELKPENVCYICDSFSTVASMGGTVMKHCSTIDYSTPTTSIIDGYSEHTYDEQLIRLYKMSGNEKIAIVSCNYGSVCDIHDVVIPAKKIKAVVNANYFMMNDGGGYLGRVQGYKNGTLEHIDARPSSPAEWGSKDDKAFMDLVVTKQGNVSFGDFNSWDYPINEVVLGTSPAGVEISSGVAVNKYSPAVGYSKITTPNTQTMLIRCFDGAFALGVVDGNIAPIPTLRTWGLIVGVEHLSIYDSGGSTQMLVNGKDKMYTGRKCPVWFVIYEDDGDPVIPVFPTESIGEVICQDYPMHIRENVVSGKVLTTVGKGKSCELLGFVDNIQSDGYQWIITRLGNIVGYSQLDTNSYWIKLYEKEELNETV